MEGVEGLFDWFRHSPPVTGCMKTATKTQCRRKVTVGAPNTFARVHLEAIVSRPLQEFAKMLQVFLGGAASYKGVIDVSVTGRETELGPV